MNRRSVQDMDSIFSTIRRLGLRRGPQRLLGGIAGGLAHRLSMSVWLVRLLVLLSFLLPVIGVVLYLLIWIVTPWHNGSIPLERSLQKRPPAH